MVCGFLLYADLPCWKFRLDGCTHLSRSMHELIYIASQLLTIVASSPD